MAVRLYPDSEILHSHSAETQYNACHACRFDAFLKENDEKVQDAIKKAEIEAKAKQDKVGPQVPLPERL